IAARLERAQDAAAERRLWLLRVAGKVGEGMDAPVFAVGGFVRDLLLGRTPPDLDLCVEGDGVAFARRLAEEAGGTLVVHPDFGTASLEGAGGRAGGPSVRIDVASARREQYERPGALPTVSPAGIEADLGRRDFSVNAMAISLLPGSFGKLLDPFGGQRDLGRRRLSPLHPLSFVEDPTRIWRAARYASRLGFALDPSGARALRLALVHGPYPALSGQRLWAEVELLGAEETGWTAFERLLRWRALTIWDRGYQQTKRTAVAIKRARGFLAWSRVHGVTLDPAELAAVALLADQRAQVTMRCLARLGMSGDRLSRLRRAAGARELARRLDRLEGARPSRVADLLEREPALVLAGAWLVAGPAARRRIEWFLRQGRAVRPGLSGDEVLALGVPPGPAVGRCLGLLRRLRLDGRLTTVAQEREFVKQWTRKGGVS
ncbi:MAG TPA: hypothetical protein VFN71_03925, partial [Methylomirabilota bacterium]|nr:hypothetical protein [Methylomirabilota bacterium]